MQTAVWKGIAVIGVTLILGGIVPEYIDVATRFRFEGLSQYYNCFFSGLVVGLVLTFVGLIAWARHIGRRARMRMAGLVFIGPWVLGLLGYPISGDNIHGPSALVILLIIPASLLAVVLLVMAGFAAGQ